MNIAWIFIAIVVILIITYLLVRPTGGRGWMLWQVRDTSRGDGGLETFVTEEELKRTGASRDRDLAP